ncbi:sulfatase [Candidatus Aminicenantes bacterium AC-335-A11]|nr:sulfatase [Candidatus Aminicenantes bacterium AC-335-A11]
MGPIYIIFSPRALKNLIKNFELIEEDLTGKWKYLPEFSDPKFDVWGVSTEFPVLGINENQKPEGMELLREDRSVKFFREKDEKDEYWKWVKVNKIVSITSHKNYSGKLRGVILKENEPLELDVFFPDSEIILDIVAVNPNVEISIPIVKVYLNNILIEKFPVTRKKFYRVREKVKIGKYKLRLEYSNTKYKNVPLENRYVVIGMIKISSPKDVILLFHKKEELRPSKLNNKYKVRYYAILEQKVSSLQRKGILKLFDIQSKYDINDYDIKSNPYQIKKKIPLNEFHLNILFSPPRSEYKFDLKISSDSILEFGCGIFDRNFDRQGNGVNFIITLETEKERKILFSKNLNPFKNVQDREIFMHRIDLSSFKNRKIKLSFITEREEKGRNSKIEPAFWFNPIIYSLEEPKKEKPNIILISIDTLRADHLSCYGYKRATSPNIDKLARDGVLFLNCYSSTSWTLPAHISLFTSLNSYYHQVYFPFQKMDEKLITLTDILRNNNYFCAAFTGGGYLSAKYGFAKSFDTYKELKIKGNVSLRYDEVELLSKDLLDWLENNKKKKFFLFLHTYQPHDPYANLSSIGKLFLNKNHKWDQINLGEIFNEGKNDRFSISFTPEEKENIIALYDGEIRYTDEYFIKPLIDKLKSLNLYNNTLIILTSDHGEEFYEHKAWLHDHSLYNEAIKIPLIIKFPNSKFRGKKIEQTVRLIDIMPSILDFLKIKYSRFNLEGKSFINLLNNKKDSRIVICDLALRKFRNPYPTVISLIKGNLKLIINKRIISPYVKKICSNFKEYKVELYDIKKDPKETVNLAKRREYQRIIRELINTIESYYKEQKKSETQEVELDKELKQRLKALGYIK